MDEVKKYLSNTSVNAPFFLVVGDDNYAGIKSKLLEAGLKPVTVSGCCSAADKPPSIDNLISKFDFADIDGNSTDKKIVVLGLGEYLALRGEREAFKWLSDIKDKKVGNARVVLLLRGVSEFVRRLQINDPARFDSRRVFFSDNTDSKISIAIVPPILNILAKNGIKELIEELENGKTTISVKTNATFDNHLVSVRAINSAYDGIKHIRPTFPLDESFGTVEQWTEFLSALNGTNGEINTLIEEFGKNPDNMLLKWINGTAYKNWLYFITLKLKSSAINNSYLKYVVEITANFNDFKKNIISKIIDIPHIDERFEKFYEERKELVGRCLISKKFNESDIAMLFVADNRRNLTEALYKLTDQTLIERKEFVALFNNIDKQIIIDRANITYTALPDYLRKYTFTDPKVSTEFNMLLTDYFDRYKWQKVLNRIEDDFLTHVEDLAIKRVYNSLRTRREVISSLDKTDTFLYWVDALGVEFLGFIQKLCERKGLSLNIHIAQAELPTITSPVNNAFFAEWDINKREKEERLDGLKHKESGGYNYENEKLPVHLAEELDILTEVLEKAAVKLVQSYKKILIVSDHGASRLAVIKEQDEKYDTDTKGKHGGRCRKKPDDYSPTVYDLPFATEGGNFIVLANYGRFKGSRKANVEVHGGASLEEVVVPIIEITLANPDITIELIDGDKIFASFRKPLEFTLFSKTELHNVSVIINGNLKPYKAVKTDKNHYCIIASDIKRPGDYCADVFVGDNRIGKVEIYVQSETQKKNDNDDFDSLF